MVLGVAKKKKACYVPGKEDTEVNVRDSPELARQGTGANHRC